MTDSFRREGEYPQENSPAPHAPFGAYPAAGAGAATYPPPPAYPPAAPGWHEAHQPQPQVIRGETVPPGAGGAGEGGGYEGDGFGSGGFEGGGFAGGGPHRPAQIGRAHV